MVKVSDYVVGFLHQKNVRDVFIVSGGASMHLLESLGNSNINYYCNHHEQASAMSAEGYARITKKFGVCLVSSGPAQTNALTGLMCAWEDSVPVMFISGNCGSKWLKQDPKLRQRGVHEVDILPMVKDVTKYAVRITDPTRIKYELECAYAKMMDERRGPVWIDIPVDVQGSMVDETTLESYINTHSHDIVSFEIFNNISKALQEASKPIFVLGGGAIHDLYRIMAWLKEYKIPFVCTKNAYGYIDDYEFNYAGMIGINGSRQANYAVQNADLLIVLGSRLSIPSIGYETTLFAPKAKKIVVDIDYIQLKYCNIHADIALKMDVALFMDILYKNKFRANYSDWFRDVIIQHNVDVPFRPINKNYVDAYNFYDQLSSFQNLFDILVTDQGAAFYAWSQSFQVEDGVSFTNGGFSPMGYGLPAAIGACIANGKKPTVCVTGDGGFEMNVQELQTIVQYDLPIKIFVFNNHGYGSIRNTQDAYFKGHYVGSDPTSGVSCVSVQNIAEAYNIPSYCIKTDLKLGLLDKAFKIQGPVLIDVLLDPCQKIAPKVVSFTDACGNMCSVSLDEMSPSIE